MNSLGKQAVSPGSIEIITLSFLVYVFKTHKNFSLHFFLKMDKYSTLLKINLSKALYIYEKKITLDIIIIIIIIFIINHS